MVLNMGPLDWESSTLTTWPLLQTLSGQKNFFELTGVFEL